MAESDDQHYDRLNAIERVKAALAKHVAGQTFDADPADIAILAEEYDRLRSGLPR
ncbi:hypothetical protein [Tardiphaga alba]|uniref:hypothetical protein n=1 Tax=Tardiphaga alba TaxID=340268 RepID=UPI001BA65DCE|nr:hypothetical protein [Tardiphaga alba]